MMNKPIYPFRNVTLATVKNQREINQTEAEDQNPLESRHGSFIDRVVNQSDTFGGWVFTSR